MTIKKIFSNWLPFVFWAGFIFYLSSIPNLKASQHPFWDEIIRSFLHFFFYLILYLLCFRAIGKKSLHCFLFVLAYSISDELHQYFVPTRSFQFADLVIDNIGNLLGLFLTQTVFPSSPQSLKKWIKKLDLFPSNMAN